MFMRTSAIQGFRVADAAKRQLLSLIILAALLTTPVLAQNDKFEIHGFLTQAYATADFASGPASAIFPAPQYPEALLGIPDDGTWNYRNMAIQFRYAITENDIMIVQLSNSAIGDSPIEGFRDEVELDWAFYERRLGPDTGIKIGRVQVPLGIYNEIRDVGTVLPFFRPAFSNYLEGSFTSETVDGAAFYHTFNADGDWSLDVDFYVGEYETFEISFLDINDVATVKAKNVFGTQLWLNTPIDGLRFGASASTRELSGGLEGLLRLPGEEPDVEDYWLSVEGAFERWVFRAEWRQFEPSVPSPLPTGNSLDLENSAWYVQLGWYVTEKFHIFLQTEHQNTKQSSPDQVRGFDFDPFVADGIALNYLFSPNVVLKAEYHWTELENAALFPAFTPMGPKLDGFIVGADGGNYGIISLAVAF